MTNQELSEKEMNFMNAIVNSILEPKGHSVDMIDIDNNAIELSQGLGNFTPTTIYDKPTMKDINKIMDEMNTAFRSAEHLINQFNYQRDLQAFRVIHKHQIEQPLTKAIIKGIEDYENSKGNKPNSLMLNPFDFAILKLENPWGLEIPKGELKPNFRGVCIYESDIIQQGNPILCNYQEKPFGGGIDYLPYF